MTFTVEQCKGCLHAVYPARYLCPAASDRTGARSQFVRHVAAVQRSAGPTRRRLPGMLWTDAGPIVIARLAGSPHANGRRYALRWETGALIAES